jgi:hypothetical protein
MNRSVQTVYKINNWFKIIISFNQIYACERMHPSLSGEAGLRRDRLCHLVVAYHSGREIEKIKYWFLELLSHALNWFYFFIK